MKDSDPFEQIKAEYKELEKKISKLEKENEKLKERIEEYQKKYKAARKKINELEARVVNTSEIEQLKIENGKLLVKLNELKRHDRALEKIKKIERILKSG